MGRVRFCADAGHRPVRLWAALAAVVALAAAGCQAAGTSKAGGAPETVANGTITLTFASADLLPVDSAFIALVSQYSGGHLKLRPEYSFNTYSTSVDQTIAAALQKGTLDVGDVGSRAWESLGVEAFRAYQEPFLISSRELLDQAASGRVAAGLLPTLKPAKITGLAIVPDSIRYLYSTRPLTTLAQFRGARIRINVSDTSAEVITDLGAVPVTSVASGSAAVQALRAGRLTAIESNPVNAIENGYVQVAPYVVVNAPLFAKTDTLAINSAVLAKLPARDAGWLRLAALQAADGRAALAQDTAADSARWATACGQGLRPLALTQQQFAALHNAEAGTFADLAADPQTALAVDRIGGLATGEPRMDSWATCHGVGNGASPTKVLDGTYGITVTQADVVASGDCTDCGNAGTFTLAIHDGRYALYHPVQLNANPGQASVADQAAWKPADPVEIGTISIAGNKATFVPDTSQQNGSTSFTATFELFRGLLTLRTGPGEGDVDSTGPWRRLS
jgi:TRAP-type C4-dicarboxylate transport system substrate-binding protein